MTASVDILLVTCGDYNHLRKTIESIFYQDYKNWRLIIVNDATKDSRALDYMKSIHSIKNEIIIVDNQERIGLTKSLCNSEKLLVSKYIARIDTGDIWEKRKISTQVDFMEKHPNIHLLGTQVNFILDDMKIVGRSNYATNPIDIKKQILSVRGVYSHSTIIFKRNPLIYYDPLYYHSQDLDLYLKYIENGFEIANLSEPLSSTLYDFNGISIKNKPLQIKCVNRAINNYFSRESGRRENRKPFKISNLETLLWQASSKFYLRYLKNSKSNIIKRFFFLGLSIVIYPPLLGIYKYRLVGMINLVYKRVLI